MTIDARPSQTQPLQAARAPGPALDVAWLLNVAWNRRRGIVATVAACMLAALLFGLFASFPEEQSAARAEAARRASTSLNARLAELRERLQQAEQRVEDYKKANNLVSSGGTLVNERQLTEINSQLVLAQSRSAEAKARFDKIRDAQRNRADPGAISEATGSATIAALRTQLAEIARKQDEINATLGKRHPAVIEIESQARRIRGMIAEEVARIAEAARNDMERTLANEATLAANLEAPQVRARRHQRRRRQAARARARRAGQPLGLRSLPGTHARGERAGAARHHQHPHDRDARPAGKP